MKSNLELVQELLEDKLNNLNEKIDINNSTLADKIDVNNKNLLDKVDTNNHNVLELLNFIREQTTKTNGRVLRAEDDIKALFKLQSQHYTACPNAAELRKAIDSVEERVIQVEKDSFVLKIWNKYPKQATLGILTSLLIFVGGLGYGIYEIHKAIKDIETNKVLIEAQK